MQTRAKLGLSLTVVSTVLGIMLGLQYRQTEAATALGLGNGGVSTTTDQHLEAQLNQLKTANNHAEQQLTQVTTQLANYEQKSTGTSSALKQLQVKMTDERILAGLTPVQGPGITLALMDGTANGSDVEQILTHDWNIRSVINELFTAGAEAVSINGYRVVATSGVFCSGPVVRVNNHRLGAPFVINAIGDPQVLKSAMDIQGGILDMLRGDGLQVTAPTIKQNMVMPAFTGNDTGSVPQD